MGPIRDPLKLAILDYFRSRPGEVIANREVLRHCEPLGLACNAMTVGDRLVSLKVSGRLEKMGRSQYRLRGGAMGADRTLVFEGPVPPPDLEDDGQAMILVVGESDESGEGDGPCLSVRLVSWDPDGGHATARALEGRTVRVTIEEVPDHGR